MRSIVELGVQTGQRTLRMLELASLHVPIGEIRYTGVDLFEARRPVDGPGLSLIEAHRIFKATGAKVQLLPGEPFMALSRAANSLGGTDLVVVSADQDTDSLARAWFYLPRMLHAQSQIFLQEAQQASRQITIRRVSMSELADLAGTALRRQAA